MKGCPICNKKYPDDMLKCEKCNIELMDWKVAENIYLYGYDRIKGKNPREYQIVLEYQRHNGTKNTYKNVSDINAKYTPNNKTYNYQPKANIEANVPKCPTCGSTNIRKITATEKAAGVVIFGLFSNKRKYQFECQNPKCKYKW